MVLESEMVTILRSKIFSIDEICIFAGKDMLLKFLSNRVIVNSAHWPHGYPSHKGCWGKILCWIEETCEGKVVIEESPAMKKTPPLTEEFSYYIYFELETDLAMFSLRWQGKNR